MSQFHFPARLKIKKEVLFKKRSNEPPATATKVGIIIALPFLSHGNFGFSFYLPRTTRLLPPCNKEGITPPKRHVFRAKGEKRIPRNFVCERRSAQNSSSATFFGHLPPPFVDVPLLFCSSKRLENWSAKVFLLLLCTAV